MTDLSNLAHFIAALDAAGELVRVRHPVYVDRELCEIADRAMKSPEGGPALLFESVNLFDGSRSAYPVAINLFGSMRRMEISMGVQSLDEIQHPQGCEFAVRRALGDHVDLRVPGQQGDALDGG